MGNSQTKEARNQGPSFAGPATSNASPTTTGRQDRIPDQSGGDRPSVSTSGRRSSRHDLLFLGLGTNSERETANVETRRETKQEREARKLEKERAVRLVERERSMREEHVDGGYLVTQGVYVGIEDYNKMIVRQLMIERRLAPFWRGLDDYSESWAEHQLVAAARGLPIPPADEVPPELEFPGKASSPMDTPRSHKHSHSLLTPPSHLTQFHFANDSSYPSSSVLSSSSPLHSPSTATPVFRTRAKTLASLTTSSRNNSQGDMSPRELQLPRDPTVNGQQIEVFLYKNASECPICFLYYPPYLNTTRCCDQPMCSECFVQIKRPDPHPPEHEQPDPNAPLLSDADREAHAQGQLVSEVATCPFCKQPEFGVTFAQPPFRRGLSYTITNHPYSASSAVSSQTSLASSGANPSLSRRRGTSLSANAPGVITTDRIRPDWASKLASARAHAARRSAAATALHTAAYLMGGSSQADPRLFAPFGRRNVLRRQTLEGNGNGTPLDALALLAERTNGRAAEAAADTRDESSFNHFLPPPRGSSNGRNRVDELEDMMMMEAIRLSLAAEEDRRRKEEKEAKKEAKKKEKEIKKAEKAAKRSGSGIVPTTSQSSHIGPDMGASARFDSEMDLPLPSTAKGKAVDRHPISLSTNSLPLSQPDHLASSSPRRSLLRQMSQTSSSNSSSAEPAGGGGGSEDAAAATAAVAAEPGSDSATTEPTFNFRSLAAMIGEQELGQGRERMVLEAAEEREGETAKPTTSKGSVEVRNVT